MKLNINQRRDVLYFETYYDSNGIIKTIGYVDWKGPRYIPVRVYRNDRGKFIGLRLGSDKTGRFHYKKYHI